MSAYRAAPAYLDLENGLRNMLKEGRLSEGDIPDDWQWLGEMLSKIEEMKKDVSEEEASAIEMARKKYLSLASDDIEIDDRPATSEADDGVWINAWLWVLHEEYVEPN